MDDKQGRKPATIRTGNGPLLSENSAPTDDSTDWEAVYEAQLAEETTPPGGILNNQFAKIGCGCFLPLIAAMGSCAGTSSVVVGGQAETVGYLFGTVMAGMALCWVPLFLFWLREQKKWIIAASFVALAVFFVVTSLGKIGREMNKINDDFSIMRDITLDKDGNAVLADGAKAQGPFGKMLQNMITERDALFVKFEGDILALGSEQLADAKLLSKDSSPLRNCAAFANLQPKVEAYHQQARAMIIQMRDKIEAMDYSDTMKREMMRGYDDSRTRNIAVVDRQWAMHKQMVSNYHKSCVVLARRNWTAQGSIFSFTNRRDMDEFNSIISHGEKIQAEYTDLLEQQSSRTLEIKEQAVRQLDKKP